MSAAAAPCAACLSATHPRGRCPLLRLAAAEATGAADTSPDFVNSLPPRLAEIVRQLERLADAELGPLQQGLLAAMRQRRPAARNKPRAGAAAEGEEQQQQQQPEPASRPRPQELVSAWRSPEAVLAVAVLLDELMTKAEQEEQEREEERAGGGGGARREAAAAAAEAAGG